MSEAINRTGYPSIDKPWNRYFNTIDGGNTVEVPTETIFNYLKKCNADNLDGYALDFFGHKITYRELFDRVEKVAVSMRELGIEEDEIISIISVNAVEPYELMYAANRAGAVFDFISCLADHKALVHYFQDNESKKVFVLDLFAEKVMKAAKEAFAEYLDEATLDSRQIYFVNQIVEYIVRNGLMKDLSVLQESPFTDKGSVVEIFTDMAVWMGIRKAIELVNANAVA